MQYELKFTEEEMATVLRALSQMPYNVVGALIGRIISDAEGQVSNNTQPVEELSIGKGKK